MAALLRSARLLKFSPSGLLQIAGTKRTGPPLGRLYSGSVCGGRSGVCFRQISPVSDNASSRVWPYAVGCVRSYAVATEHKDDVSTAVQSKQAQQFDWALKKLDSSVRRTGRITKTMLLRIFHDISRAGYPSANQALLLLRSCGSLLPEVPLMERTELAHRVWKKMQELGVQYDVSHYNALLKVYLQNEFKFSPTDFLAKMEAANIQPNRVTYQRLIAAYCESGDIEGASTILGFMKSKDLPITEAVFSSLVTGHARAGDIESAKNILPVMRGAGIEPSPDTYVSLLNVYAERGDWDAMKQTLEAADAAECNLMDRDLMQVIFSLAKSGNEKYIPHVAERFRHERGFIPDAMNLCLNLVTQGKVDSSFLILKIFPSLQSDGSSDSMNLGNFFLRHCITMETPPEKIVQFCKELQEGNMHSAPLSFALFCALDARKTGIALGLMKLYKEQGLPLRPHFFWPLLAPLVKENNTAGVVDMLKNMQELGVSVDIDTLSTYFTPVFPSPEAAEEALKDTGITMDSGAFLRLEIRSLASNDLAKLYTTLSDPSFPPVDLTLFRNSLIAGFKKSSDVESMVKITQLLFKDERFCKETWSPSGSASFLLYNLIDSMSAAEASAQEEKLRKFFNQLRAVHIMIPFNIYRGIRNLLESYQVPQLIKEVLLLVDRTDKVLSDSETSESPFSHATTRLAALEATLTKLNEEGKALGFVLKQAFQVLSQEEDLERALELKRQYEDKMTVASYATLINLCCRHNNAEEALNLKREMCRKDSSVVLNTSKYITLVKTLFLNDKIEEAVDILKEMKEKEVVFKDTHTTSLFHVLNAVAHHCSTSAVQRLQDTIFTSGLVKPTANLCSPVITSYLESKDLSGALAAAEECQKRYNLLPRIHDITTALIEKGDTELLQKAMDMVSHSLGEMAMLYELFFAFLQTGRYREAQKIIETPGLRAKPGRMQWFADKCISNHQMEPLEKMVEMTVKLFECDRDQMYGYILRFCKETNNWQKADATWTKMQEENVIPREKTLRLLAEILKDNGQEVPFDVPESWFKQPAAPQRGKPDSAPAPAAVKSGSDYQIPLLSLCKKGKANEAYGLLMEADVKGVVLAATVYDHVVRCLLANGSIDDAMTVVDLAKSRVADFKMSAIASNLFIITCSAKGQPRDGLEKLKAIIELDQVPSRISVTRLVQSLGVHGDVSGIQEVEEVVKKLGPHLNLSSMVITNNIALAHIKNGDVDSAVELLEGIYTSPKSTHPSMSFVFRKVMEDGHDQALDKLSAMAERLANHFACYRPASDLFLQLLDMDKVEDAKFMLARVNALAEQKQVLLSFVSKKTQNPGEIGKINNLLSLIPDFVEKEVLYPYLMKCHVLDVNLTAAKALYEQMKSEGMVVDELSLKRLAGLYHKAGETPPFSEPPESFKFYADKLKEKFANAKQTSEE
ncbi:leucine-rich PPR motif-containing protein, mitochondrial [Mugil cephalus]|uniref:leucine-rich PPR motif-containing protein, mitochondrial n=1 Tax=Mugil cephalus TaxID=48193 RepID=UPI001FB6D548|nr:leucine-rich PPR motif-containing protein, mitochondrial [Mugil cephalus]